MTRIECYLDLGGLDANGQPVNDWKLFWSTISRKFTGKCNGIDGGCRERGELFFFRLDDIPRGHQQQNVELKFASGRKIIPPS